MNHLKTCRICRNFHTYEHALTHWDGHTNIGIRRHQHTRTGNKRGACFYCSTFCSFALPSLSPEGRDSSVSGEISCMIEQRGKETVPSSLWQSPRWATQGSWSMEAVCVCVYVRNIRVRPFMCWWWWKVTLENAQRQTKSNLTQVRIPKYKHFENHHCSVSCSA